MKTLLFVLVMALVPFSAFAGDGQMLINQSTVMSSGGFPYKVMQPGSYKLSGNLTVPLNVNGIEIGADGVTLDLNGFSITGPGMFPNAGSGVYATDRQRILLSNGSVSGFVECLQFVGSSRMIVLEKLFLDATTRSSNGNPVLGIVAIVGSNSIASAIIRDVVAIGGQLQLTCPGLVRDTTLTDIVELSVPPNLGVKDFPTNCKGENVVFLGVVI